MLFLKNTHFVTRAWMTLAFLLGMVVCSAQDRKTNTPSGSGYYSNFKPDTPEKAALGSFGNVPINYFTGLPEINLNLVTLPSRDLNLPVSINYDATGLKVDDISGPVGLKWNLNAGGYIVRQLNGTADEEPTKGYWARQATLNAASINVSSLVGNSEQNDMDTQPDEFYVYLPGQTIKFFFKDGTAHPVPRQNLKIVHTVTNNKLTGFTIYTSDGMEYSFGTNTNAIEQRQIQNLSMVYNFAFDTKAETYECIRNNNMTTDFYTWFYAGTNLSIDQVQYNEKIEQSYNSKWYLVSIKSPNLDVITFNYIKSGTTAYATQPVVNRKMPLLTAISNYTFNETVCYNNTEFGCADHRNHTVVHDDWDTPAYAAFSNSCPDHDNCNNSSPPLVTQDQSNLYFDPKQTRVNPEAIFVNQSLIVESSIRLDNITAATGSKVKFYYSSRQDLPNAYQCDRIELVNMQNTVVKNFKLKYTVVDADRTNNYMWLSEAYMLSRIPAYEQGAFRNYYADDLLNNTSTDISSLLARKYVFEGTRQYNYKRLFLDGINEISTTGSEQFMYSFTYEERTKLKRRLTPAQTISGFSRDYVEPEILYFGADGNNWAHMTNALDPASYRDDAVTVARGTRGMLTSMTYPTGGSTLFTFVGGYSPSLTHITDYDNNGAVVAERHLQYLSDAVGSDDPILTSYQNTKVAGTGLYLRHKISCSMPQNRSFRPLNGVFFPKTKVWLYNGKSATEHNGYEIFTFYLEKDIVAPIFSTPKDVNTAGQELNFLSSSEAFPFPKRNQKDYLSGLPHEHIVYDQSGRMLKSTKNEYDSLRSGYARVKIKGFMGGSFKFDGGTKYRYVRNTISTDWIALVKTTEKVYDQSGSYSESKFRQTVTTYDYDNVNLRVSYAISTTPEGVETVNYKYVDHTDYNYSGTASPEIKAIHRMRSNHQKSAVVEERTYFQPQGGGARLTSCRVNTFKIIGTSPNERVKPDKVFFCNEGISAGDPFTSSKANSSGALVFDTRLRQVHSYDLFDTSNGNMLKQTGSDGIAVNYVWNSNLANALIKDEIVNEGATQSLTNYSHLPLVGTTMVADPNGVISSYQYDEFRRLKLTQDQSNNIINRYRYHYVTNNANESLTASIIVSGARSTGAITNFETPNQGRPGTTTCVWDFGDGSTSTGTSHTVGHTYAATGTYVVKLTKSNPEYGSASAQITVTIVAPPQVTICADGPIRIDLCRIMVTADGYGDCTQPQNRYFSAMPKLKATGSSGCGGFTYRWEYKLFSSSTWINFGGGSPVDSPFYYPVNSGGEVRCIATDACGRSVTSSTIQFLFFKSNSSCNVQ